MRTHSIALFVLLLTPGCSDDAAPSVDAPTQTADASDEEARCLVAPNHGNLGAQIGMTTAGMSPTSLTIVLDAGPPRDSFFINLKNGIPTGTYQIDGANAVASTCSLCVNILADIVSMQGPSKFYFATSGSVTLTATEPPAGMLSNVVFVETSVSGEPLDSGCGSRIDAMSFGPS